ncbi:MAG TPA: RHS repeat-associated core domain-containing protein [Candidatus Nanoarchaeia archaeon]|nr:RHS repeat-associated core domain-containing protein [Candidatus Nanoarchaeia archaeon]
MKKEVICIFLVFLLLAIPFSSAQLTSIEIISVKVNESAIKVLVDNKLEYDVIKETFIINNQYTIIQEVEFPAFNTITFTVNYPTGIKLETLQVIIDKNNVNYTFTGNEESFDLQQNIAQQQTSQAITITESNSPISYIYSGTRVAKIQDNNVVYFSSDNIGSTSLETDSSGTIEFKANYLPFGKELSFSSTGKEKYGFTGKEYDAENSLNYFNARYYNPSNGKFISVDSIFKPSEGGYQYVRNNPLTITDPSGKDAPKLNLPKNLPNFIKDNPLYQEWQRIKKEEERQEKENTEAITNAINEPGYVSEGLRSLAQELEGTEKRLSDANRNLARSLTILYEEIDRINKLQKEEAEHEIIFGNYPLYQLEADLAQEESQNALAEYRKTLPLHNVLPIVINEERSHPLKIKTKDIKPLPLPETFDDNTAKIFYNIFKQ